MERQRTAAPAPRCSFSDLPSPVAAHIFSLLSNDDRLPMLDVCTAWHAIVDAGGPALWPTAVIKGPMDISASTDNQAEIDAARRPALYDCSFHQNLLGKAAGLSPRLRSLFVDADSTQPETILSILAVVPAVSLVRLSIKGRSPGLLPVVLQRFRQLQRVELTGDASRVSWEGPGGTWLARMICSLELAPVIMENEDGDEAIISDDLCLSSRRAAHLGAALSQLTRLAITVCWDDDTSVPALVAALPTLQAFSLCARGVANAKQAASVVKLLASLPLHLTIDLTVTRAVFIDREYDYEDWEEFQLPSGLAAVPGLNSLLLGTGIELPPDWLQLSRLRALTLHNDDLERLTLIEHPFTSLTQLQLHMSSGDVAPALASLTSLQSLRLESRVRPSACGLPASLTALTALTCLEVLGFDLPSLPASVQDMSSLRTLAVMPSPNQLPAGRYLEGLQELRWTGSLTQYSVARDLPPSLALATCLERLEVSVLDFRCSASGALLLAKLPALRAVTVHSMSDNYTGFKSNLRALRPDLRITSWF